MCVNICATFTIQNILIHRVGVPKPKCNLHFFDLWSCTVEKLAFLLVFFLCFSNEINSFSLFLNSYLFIYLILLKFILIDFEVKQIMFQCYFGFGTPVPQTEMGGGTQTEI